MMSASSENSSLLPVVNDVSSGGGEKDTAIPLIPDESPKRKAGFFSGLFSSNNPASYSRDMEAAHVEPTPEERLQDQIQTQQNIMRVRLENIAENEFRQVRDKRNALKYIYEKLPHAEDLIASSLLYSYASQGISEDTITTSIHRYKPTEEHIRKFDWLTRLIFSEGSGPDAKRTIYKYRFNLDTHHNELCHAIKYYCSNCVALTDDDIQQLRDLYTTVLFVYPNDDNVTQEIEN